MVGFVFVKQKQECGWRKENAGLDTHLLALKATYFIMAYIKKYLLHTQASRKTLMRHCHLTTGDFDSSLSFFIFFKLFAVLGFELRALSLLGRHSST
jgi:hypothetical protein